MQRTGRHPSVAPTLATVTSPWTEDEVKNWIGCSLCCGHPGFRSAIFLLEIDVIGSIGLGKVPGRGL